VIKAQSATASGQGQIIRKADKEKQQVFAAGGIIEGKGQIIRKDGTVQDFIVTSDPLTPEQAEALNNSSED